MPTNSPTSRFTPGASDDHLQNTDTGTSSSVFQIDNDASGPKLKHVSTVLQIRNAGDTDFADLQANDLILAGDLRTASHTFTLPSGSGTLALTAELGDYIPLTQKAAASGVATLDSGGKIPQAQLPALAITDTFVVASQAAMLALSAAETGDVAVRTDLNKTFILTTNSPGTLADWQELLSPTDAVQSVNGQSGTVVLDATDITQGYDGAFLVSGMTVEEALSELDGSLESVASVAHVQNTDVGTNSSTFLLDSDGTGILLKNSGGTHFAIRNADDTAYAAMQCSSAGIFGAATINGAISLGTAGSAAINMLSTTSNTITASGPLSLASGGTNQHITLAPNGVGQVQIGGTNPTVSVASGTLTLKGASVLNLEAFSGVTVDSNTGTFYSNVSIETDGNVSANGGTVSFGPMDITLYQGDIDLATVFRVWAAGLDDSANPLDTQRIIDMRWDDLTEDRSYTWPDESGTILTSTQKGVANGLATLGADGKLDADQMPAEFQIRFRRDSLAALVAMTTPLAAGEPAWATDIKALSVGDDTTPGGIPVSYRIVAAGTESSVTPRANELFITSDGYGLGDGTNTVATLERVPPVLLVEGTAGSNGGGDPGNINSTALRVTGGSGGAKTTGGGNGGKGSGYVSFIGEGNPAITITFGNGGAGGSDPGSNGGPGGDVYVQPIQLFTGNGGNGGAGTGDGGAGGGAMNSMIYIGTGNGGAASSTGNGGSGGTLSSAALVMTTGSGGSSTGAGSGGAGGGASPPSFRVQCGNGGNATSGGSGGVGGSLGGVGFGITTGAGGNGGAVANGGNGGAVSGLTLIGGAGGAGGTTSSAGGNGGSGGSIQFGGGMGGAGSTTTASRGGGVGGNGPTWLVLGGSGGAGEAGAAGAAGGNAGGLQLNGGNANGARAGGAAGSIVMNGSSATASVAGAAAGSLTTSANGVNAGGSITTAAGASGAGGAIDLSGGAASAGGSITMSNGGGSLNTTGTGSLQFGVAATRTTLNGSATAARTITMPDKSGTMAVILTATLTASWVAVEQGSGTEVETQTVAVTGAAVGDEVALGLSANAGADVASWTAWVSAADTVSIRRACVGTQIGTALTSEAIKVSVIKR